MVVHELWSATQANYLVHHDLFGGDGSAAGSCLMMREDLVRYVVRRISVSHRPVTRDTSGRSRDTKNSKERFEQRARRGGRG